MIPYFGDPWPAQFFDANAGVPIATPVGELCSWCEEPIQAGDRGIVTPFLDLPTKVAARPLHRECLTRTVMGSVAHVTSQCICCGRSEAPYPGSRRAEALAVQAIVDDSQGLSRGPGRGDVDSG